MPDVLFEALCATLDHFDSGFVVVFPDGKILHANRMAHEMMAEGWPIQSNNGSLQACSKKATTLLLKSLRQVTQTTERSPSDDISLDICLADAASPKGVAIATMKPLINARLDPSPVALFVTSIKSRGDCALAAIAECFGLTPAETRTLHHFVAGWHGCRGWSCAGRLGKYCQDPSAEHLRQDEILAASAAHQTHQRSQTAFEADGQRRTPPATMDRPGSRAGLAKTITSR